MPTINTENIMENAFSTTTRYGQKHPDFFNFRRLAEELEKDLINYSSNLDIKRICLTAYVSEKVQLERQFGNQQQSK